MESFNKCFPVQPPKIGAGFYSGEVAAQASNPYQEGQASKGSTSSGRKPGPSKAGSAAPASTGSSAKPELRPDGLCQNAVDDLSSKKANLKVVLRRAGVPLLSSECTWAPKYADSLEREPQESAAARQIDLTGFHLRM